MKKLNILLLSLIILMTITSCKKGTEVTQESLPVISIVSEDGKNEFVTEPVSAAVKEQKKGWITDPNDPQLTAPDPYYVNCSVTVKDSDNTLLDNVSAEVKVRGNWTTDYDKKPLRIKFTEKQNILGLHNGEKYKNWVLLAGYKDWSLLRDSTALMLSSLITEGYVTDYKLVSVEINGQYWGVYLLVEQQQVSEGRIDITEPKKKYEGTDIGYFLEFDGYYKYEDYSFEMDYSNYKINNYTKTTAISTSTFNKGYTIKSDIYSNNQVHFIQSYMNNLWKICNEAKKGNYYTFNEDKTALVADNSSTALECVSKVLDINSLVDTYIVQEIVCDPDIYWSSFYMDVDLASGVDNRLRFEAPWDFDSSLGNKVRVCEDSQGIYAGKCGRDVNNTYDAANPWMVLFVECDWFMDLVKAKYKTISFDSVYKMIEGNSEIYKDEFTKNFKRWSSYNKNSGVLNELNEASKKCKNQAQAASYLDKWLHNRIEFLDKEWK